MDNFLQQKQDILSKNDKSSIGGWDKKIVRLCGKINKLPDYYTNSSCSGRAALIIDKDKKQEGLFVKMYHDILNFEKLKKDLNELLKLKKTIRFKQEACILHVSCKTLLDAQKLYDKAKLAGWKRSGIIATGRRFIVELNSTEKLEFPIIASGKILVDDNFLKIIVKKSNENLKKSWEKIERLEKSLNNSYNLA